MGGMSALNDYIYNHRIEPSNEVMEEINRRIKHDYHIMYHRGGFNARDDSCLSMVHNSITPPDLINMIYSVISDPKALATLLTENHNLQLIIEMAQKKIQHKEHLIYDNERRKNEAKTDEQYEEAVDIVNEFQENGIDKLDEEQLEIYEESLDIIKKYENQ